VPKRAPFSPSGADFVPFGLGNLSGLRTASAAELPFPGRIISASWMRDAVSRADVETESEEQRS